MNKEKIKKIGNVTVNVLLYIFLALCIFSVIVAVFAKKDPDGTTEIFGYQMRVVTSDSMAECELTNVSDYEIKDIPLGSMVFIQLVPEDKAEADEWYRSLKVGDVLTFKYVYSTQVTITHRIVSIDEKETGGFLIELAGDNKNSENSQLYQVIDTSLAGSTNYVIGKVTGQSLAFGSVVSALKEPLVIVFVIIVPCVAIVLYEIIKLVRVFGSERKKQEQAEREKKDKELEELRSKIAELEKNIERSENEDTKK